MRYPTPGWWRQQFLRRLFATTHAALRPGAAFLVNVANNAMLHAGGLDLEAAVREEAAAAAVVAA